MRRAIRGALYQTHRHDLGCPQSNLCAVFTALNQERPCGPDNGCAHFLKPEEPYPEPDTAPRVSFLVKTEAMVNVGCKFGPNDLSYRVWEELIILAQERSRMENAVREQRESAAHVDREAQQKADEARRADKIPAPGISIFPGNSPR